MRRGTQELKQKGIDTELAEQLLENAELDWFALATDCFNRKYRSRYNPEDRKSIKRCIRSMSATGFSIGEIYSAINCREADFY
ncbi:MAG: hypothetical protein OFPI_05400 [Osedax symbiont Rs2]|nr:MAG: hypothetical protein OFPI_05400 [Osedax symbiont Rs2]